MFISKHERSYRALNGHITVKQDIVEKVGKIESVFINELINTIYVFQEETRVAGLESYKKVIE